MRIRTQSDEISRIIFCWYKPSHNQAERNSLKIKVLVILKH